MTDYNFKPKRSKQDFGWHNRGRIPHLDGEEFTQFITLRLFDSMPQEKLDEWRMQIPDDLTYRKTIEVFLDPGFGNCWLREARVAQIVQDALLFHNGNKYDLWAWVIMPNHGHVLLTPMPGVHLPDVMHSLKSFTATKANRLLRRTGQFWQHESFDRYIRDARHFSSVVSYIENNPVKAGLCSSPDEWVWGSAHYRQVAK